MRTIQGTGIYDGIPVTLCADGCTHDRELFTDLKERERKMVEAWILTNIEPRVSANKHHTSYGIKHLLERDTGIYMTNNAFKDAMLHCGFYPVDETALNWWYCISEKSKAFKK